MLSTSMHKSVEFYTAFFRYVKVAKITRIQIHIENIYHII